MMQSASLADVELKAVTKRFGDFVAVNGIDLRVSAGRFVTLLGPSGCGKTTTLRMIGGFEEPSSGQVLVRGKSVPDTSLKQRQTRMVFQSYALFPHMTVRNNVAYGLRMLGVPKHEVAARVTASLQMIGIPDKAESFPAQLSGGQQQRVALARALVTRPAVLLLDEPLGALDLKMRRRMQAELKSLQREVGITFIYVTHDQEEALALSDEIVVMQDGLIVQQGSPEEIYRRPVSTYVADFIGETNLIKADPKNPAMIAVRPEHIAVRAAGAATAAGSVLGTVTDVRFLGPYYRTTIELDGGTTIRADIDRDPPARGEKVAAIWDEKDAVLLSS
ncbi:MAG: ABC transporter ATP-binding protein [Rhizobiaceae bacterium]